MEGKGSVLMERALHGMKRKCMEGKGSVLKERECYGRKGKCMEEKEGYVLYRM